jgi:lysophospholipase L1-like esterase
MMGVKVKTILCYGDSNTWGYNPRTQDRFSFEQRWTGVLAQQLGPAFRIVEEGLNGRTTVWDDPIEGYKNGKEYLIPCLESHRPIDLVVIMLGTNDLKTRFSVSAYDIGQSAAVLVDIVQKSASGPGGLAPRVLLIAPPVVGKLTEFAEMFEEAESKSNKFSEYYRRVTELYHCHFLDAARVIVSSDLDGIHFEADQHEMLAKAIAGKVKEIFKNE